MKRKIFDKYVFIIILWFIGIGVNANNPLATKQHIGMFKKFQNLCCYGKWG